MNHTLDYANPSTTPPLSLRRVLPITLIGCPLASLVTFVVGVGLGAGFHRGDRGVCSVIGASAGLVGGLIVVAIARAFRPRAMKISIIGSLIVALLTGASGWIIALFITLVTGSG